MNSMLLQKQVTMTFIKHMKGSNVHFLGKARRRTSTILCQNVTFSNYTRDKMSKFSVNYNLYAFFQWYGLTFLSTSLWGYPNLAIIPSSWLWLITFPNMFHFCALQHPFKSSMVTRIFMDNKKIHGMPRSIVLDCDPSFTSDF
jgi:hypothetical protein